MALTPAEAQRRYRKRLKEREKTANFAASDVLQAPFFEFFSDRWGSFEECLAIAGIEAPSFEDDRGPRHFGNSGVFDHMDDDDPALSDDGRSIGRAELVIAALIDAASELALQVRNFKQSEIRSRLSEIEASDLSDPATKKAALKEAARLNKMLDQLDKQVRWTFPQWKVTG